MHFFVKDRSFYKSFFAMLSFIAIQNLIIFGVNLMDNVMLGSYGEAAMSGVSLANQIQFLLQMLVGGIGDGVAVLCAQYWGTRRIEPIQKLTAVAVKSGVIISMVFTAAALFVPEGLLALFNATPEIISHGADYMRVMAFSYLFFTLSGVLLRVHQSVETVTLGIRASLLALVVNIFLNYVFIFGHFGFPAMGATGAAIATLIARLAEFAVITLFTFKKDPKLSLKIKALFQIDRTLQKDFMRVSMPVILSGGSWGLAMLLQTVVLGHMGSAAIGANAIATTLFQVLSVVVYASASAAGVLTGKAVGRDDHTAVRAYTRTFQVIFLGMGVISSIAFQWVKPLILSLYAATLAPETAALASRFIDILSITLIGTAYQVSCLTGIVRGGGHTKFVFYNDLIFMWGIVLPSSALGAFVFNWPPEIVFFCLKSDQLLKCVVAFFEVNSYRWVKKVARNEMPVLASEE